MKTRDQIITLLASHKADLMARFKVKKLGLFGSYARNEQGPGSDVDILVDVDPSIGLEFVSLAETAEQLLGLPCHVVSSRAISPSNMEAISQDLVYV
ncbi:MAG: nucleotidyltransferase family protein [Chloroflexi bacterium]|nr:nucleotidyltransferase family protein [Chloroflexota bacterium]